MKIELSDIQINNICNALNTHAKHFDVLVQTCRDSEETKEFWREHARELRETTNLILWQRNHARQSAKEPV